MIWNLYGSRGDGLEKNTKMHAINQENKKTWQIHVTSSVCEFQDKLKGQQCSKSFKHPRGYFIIIILKKYGFLIQRVRVLEITESHTWFNLKLPN